MSRHSRIDSTTAKSLPLISSKTLSKSLRDRHYVKYTMVPKALGVLGCRGLLLEVARVCELDAKRSELRGHKHVAKCLRESAAVFHVAARNMLRVDRKVIGYLFGGGSPRIAKQFLRPAGA